MPRPSRFNPTFGERLRQSRVARGQEPEPTIRELVFPAPREPNLYESLSAVMASYRNAHGRTLFEQAWEIPNERSELYRQLAGQMRRHAMQGAHEARVQGDHIHSAIHDEFAAFAARTVQATPPPALQPPKEQPAMQNPTEQTLITVLQQGVADVLRLLRVALDHVEKHRGEIESVNINTNGYALTDNRSVTITHSNPTPLCDENTVLVTLDTYSTRKRVYAWNLVMRHSAVVQALKELKPLDSMSRYEFETLEANTIHDYAEFFAANPSTFYTTAKDGSNAGNIIPQLNQYAWRVWSRDISEYPCVPFAPTTPLWKVREAARLLSNYTALPQAIVDALGPDVMDTYYPHLATKPSNAGMVAFTQSATAGMLDRQQVIKPGRFLRQHLPDASDEQIKQYAAECLGALSAGIHHSKDPNDFQRIYINGPSSCMAYDQNGKQFGRLKVDGEFFHPARVYAHPENNIEIVWVEVAGRIGARAVINTRTKQYPALYGSDSVSGANRRLTDYLACLGYEHSDDALDHEKLLKVFTDQGAIICPYIDAGNRGVHIEDDCLVVGGSHEANHETGCLHDHDSEDHDWHCDDCGNGQDDMDDRYHTSSDETVCSHCAQNYTEARCAESGDWVWVPNGDDDLRIDRSRRGRSQRIYVGNGYGEYLILSEEFYNDDDVGHEDHCVSYAGGDYVLEEDLDRFDLFRDEDGEACSVEEYAIFDDELVRRSKVPDDAVICTDETDDDYPMLPVYRSVEEDDQEDAA